VRRSWRCHHCRRSHSPRAGHAIVDNAATHKHLKSWKGPIATGFWFSTSADPGFQAECRGELLRKIRRTRLRGKRVPIGRRDLKSRHSRLSLAIQRIPYLERRLDKMMVAADKGPSPTMKGGDVPGITLSAMLAALVKTRHSSEKTPERASLHRGPAVPNAQKSSTSSPGSRVFR
jgi:hypothetical protein